MLNDLFVTGAESSAQVARQEAVRQQLGPTVCGSETRGSQRIRPAAHARLKTAQYVSQS